MTDDTYPSVACPALLQTFSIDDPSDIFKTGLTSMVLESTAITEQGSMVSSSFPEYDENFQSLKKLDILQRQFQDIGSTLEEYKKCLQTDIRNYNKRGLDSTNKLNEYKEQVECWEKKCDTAQLEINRLTLENQNLKFEYDVFIESEKVNPNEIKINYRKQQVENAKLKKELRGSGSVMDEVLEKNKHLKNVNQNLENENQNLRLSMLSPTAIHDVAWLSESNNKSFLRNEELFKLVEEKKQSVDSLKDTLKEAKRKKMESTRFSDEDIENTKEMNDHLKTFYDSQEKQSDLMDQLSMYTEKETKLRDKINYLNLAVDNKDS